MQQREAAAAAAAASGGDASARTVAMNMTSRYLGLIVVPGHHIVKMELEQFASQMQGNTAIA